VDSYAERAETYLRLLAEAALRPAADGQATQIRRAADVLVEAGALTEPLATRILADLYLALQVRGRHEVFTPGARLRRLATARGMPGMPGMPGQVSQPGRWRLLGVGQPASGSRLTSLLLLDDRALATATLCFSPSAGTFEPDVPALAGLTATDNLGIVYRLGFTDGAWAGSTWTGTVLLTPAVPAAATRLDITGPNGPLLRAEIIAAPPGSAVPGPAPREVTESPGERLLTRRAEGMLAALALGSKDILGLSKSGLAELARTLEAAGLLSPFSSAPARLAALSQLLGLPLEGPASEVPARWIEVVTHYGRRRRPAPVTGTAAIGAILPEIDGARLAIAGLSSGGAGSFLHLVVHGLAPLPRRRQPGVSWNTMLSIWAMDDAGGWHLGAVEDVSPVGAAAGVLRLTLLPPLCRETASLTIEAVGTGQRVTADLPVRW